MVDPSLSIITIYLVCLSREEEEIKHFQYMSYIYGHMAGILTIQHKPKNNQSINYMAMPQYKNPCLKGHEIYHFCRLFLFKFFFTPKFSPLELGVMEFIISCPLTLQM